MGNVSGHQCKAKMNGSEKKVNDNTYYISSIKRVTKKFLEVSRYSRAKQRQRNVQKSVLHVQSCFFCKLDLLLFFTILRRCLRRLTLQDFNLFDQTINIIDSWLNLYIRTLIALLGEAKRDVF